MICPYCGDEVDRLIALEERKLKKPKKPFGTTFLTLSCSSCYHGKGTEKVSCFITYKPFVDKYAFGSLSNPKEFKSHTDWENYANKNNPGAYVNHEK